MTELTQEIFANHQVRKTKKQKTDFIDFAMEKAKEMGYDARVEGKGSVRNIVVGEPDTAKVIYTAHYDTCVRMPFPNFLTPKNMLVYLLYSIAIGLGFVLIAFLIGCVVGLLLGLSVVAFDLDPNIIDALAYPLGVFIYLGIFYYMMYAGPANKHTANDNTSGVTTLFEIMARLPEEKRGGVAFVFFDLEEMGLVGSAQFAKMHKSVKKNTLLVNFDCVSDGDDLLIVAGGKAASYTETLAAAFPSDERMLAAVDKKAFYPSDQRHFRYGVGVAAFKKTKGGLLYMNRIHTSRDTVYREQNIDFIADGALRLVDAL